MTGWMDQAMFTAVAAVGLLASTLMLVGASMAGPEHETAGLLAVGYIGLVISSVMLMRVVAQILRREAELRIARGVNGAADDDDNRRANG